MIYVKRNPINEVQNLFTSVFNGNGLRTNIEELENDYIEDKQYIPTLTEQIVTDAIKSTGMRVQSKKITEFIMNGYNMIEK